MKLLDKFDQIESRFKNLETQLSQPDAASDPKKFAELAREHSEAQNHYEAFIIYKDLNDLVVEDDEILNGNDDELKELVREEYEDLVAERDAQENKIKMMLVPRDKLDAKNAIVEIRAGTGGDEAAIFAGNLMRMYQRYAENKGWKIETIALNQTEAGGLKEVSVQISGDSVYGTLKFESGVHRVQRVPETESQGRVHTSAATVAVLPEAKAVDVQVLESDLRIDTYRASGAGGQHVNKTESAIRITHIPSGTVVTCQDESSQHKNKEKAMKVLYSRMLAVEQETEAKKRANMRKSLVSTGDRSAKIRTYNYPQGRVTDHRINLTLYRLEEILNGDLDELLESIVTADLINRLDEI
jgi:peptide chain release factor 1